VKDCGKNLGPKLTPHRKRNNGVKSEAHLVLGQDISISMTVNMENQAVVSKARGRRFGIKTLKEWVRRVWVHKVYVLLEVTNLASGWILFKFRKEEDADIVLKKPWLLDSIPLLLKRWTTLFDASKERLNVMSIWVRLLGLPPELWTELSFKELGNALGTFMDTYMSFREIGKMSMARILVALDVRDKLAEELVLIKEEVCFHQRLDYEGIPFKCQ